MVTEGSILRELEKMTGFLRPTDDDFEPGWSADRTDVDPTKNTSFIFNPRANWSLPAQKKNLPISKNRDHILYLLEKHQVVLIVGETGCGKSTQIPQFLVEAGWCQAKGIMVRVSTENIDKYLINYIAIFS